MGVLFVARSYRDRYVVHMLYKDPLIKGSLVRRYKRFMADVLLEGGRNVVAHCANTGSMLGLKTPGSVVWLSPSRNPTRKLKYTWELVGVGRCLVGINTALSNAIVQEAIEDEKILSLQGYQFLYREVRYGENSRIDVLLQSNSRRDCYVEVKNVTMRRDKCAEFPDAITNRGTKHLLELTNRVKAGDRGVMLYLIQRGDCDKFSIASDIDPAYADAFFVAREAGVEMLCYKCKVTREKIVLDDSVSLEF